MITDHIVKMLKKTLVSIVINNSNNEQQSVIDNNNKTYEKLLESKFQFEYVVVDAFTSKKIILSFFKRIAKSSRQQN